MTRYSMTGLLGLISPDPSRLKLLEFHYTQSEIELRHIQYIGRASCPAYPTDLLFVTFYPQSM
jgi:hypothetical protein